MNGWKKPGKCNGGACVEVRKKDDCSSSECVDIRGSRDPNKVITVSDADFAAFIEAAKAGEYDWLVQP